MKRRTFLTTTAMIGLAAVMKPLELLAAEPLTVLLPPWGTPPKDVADKFVATSGTQVDMQTLGWDEIRAKIVTSMVANTAPASVTEIDWSWVGQFGSAGWYDDLSSLVDEELKNDLPTLSIFAYDGKQLGIPYNNDFRVTIYNKAHLDKAGAAVPKTPDELLAAARAIRDKGIVEHPIGLPLSASEGSATAWYLLTKAFDGELFDADFKPLFTTPDSAGYKAMQFEVQAVKDGLIDPAATGLKDVDVQELFKAGKVSFDVAGQAGIIAVYADPGRSQVAADAKAMLVPNVTGNSRTFGLPEALGIPVPAANKEAAAAYIKWALQPDIVAENYEKLGTLPTRLSVLELLNSEGKLAEGDVLIAQAAVTEPLFQQGTPGWYPEFSGAVQTNLNAAAKGQISVDEAVKAIAKAAEEAQQ